MSVYVRVAAELAQNVVDSGAIPLLVLCIQVQPMTRGPPIARPLQEHTVLTHVPSMSLLVALLLVWPVVGHRLWWWWQEPEVTLKRIAASALSDVCKHSPELAQVRWRHAAPSLSEGAYEESV